jgi:hypothetical protein
LDALGLAAAEELDRVRIYERDFSEVEHNLGHARGYLCFQFAKVLSTNSADQLDSRAVLDESLLNLQRHACSVVQSAGRFGSVRLTGIASESVAVFSAIAHFSARNL